MADGQPFSPTDTIISPTEEILAEARAGRMVIIVDAEDRENEGDLVIPAQMANAEAINFMARFGRGLICLALTRGRANHLRLPLMTQANRQRTGTAFTVSIEARTGVTTGISAQDRARTIAVAIDPDSAAEDIVSPGHVFPLIARDGGVLVRAGHTEASVDIARMAGLIPAGVICEIMNDDGSMARLPDLAAFAKSHGLKIGTIADLIEHRRRHESYVSEVARRVVDYPGVGGFSLHVFRNALDGMEHVALTRGAPATLVAPLVRMHKVDFFADILGADPQRSGLVARALKRLAAEPDGAVMVLIREVQAGMLEQRLAAGKDSFASPPSREKLVRDYGIGAQILRALGVRRMRLLSNSDPRAPGLEGYGLTIEAIVPFDEA